MYCHLFKFTCRIIYSLIHIKHIKKFFSSKILQTLFEIRNLPISIAVVLIYMSVIVSCNWFVSVYSIQKRVTLTFYHAIRACCPKMPYNKPRPDLVFHLGNSPSDSGFGPYCQDLGLIFSSMKS